MEKLKELIEREKRKNPKEFLDAERKGELLHYLGPAMKKANINPALLNQYCKERSHDSDLHKQIETFIDTVSVNLDESLYEPYYQSNTPPNNMGIADVMAAHRASGNIRTKLKRLKVFCALGSVICLGVGVRYLTSRYIIHAAVFCVAAADLLRISYNAYDKKYCSLFLTMIGGNVTRLTDTIFKFAKSVVGMTDPQDDPLLRLRNEVLWGNLLQDTFVQKLYHKVCSPLTKLQPVFVYFSPCPMLSHVGSHRSRRPRRTTAECTLLPCWYRWWGLPEACSSI